MFPELKSYLDELENTAESTGAFLRKLNGARTRLRNAIDKTEQGVKDLKDEDKYFAGVKREIEKDALRVAKNFLVANMRHAILINEEFNEPPYRIALFRAIENNDTYMFIRKGTGFAGSLKIDINLDKTGGRIHSWAAGIKAYRKILEEEKEQKARERAKAKKKRYKKPVYSPAAASRAWAGIYKNREGTFSEFQVTVRERLSLSGQVAPFWMLLDKGNIPMRSDRGGFPTPINTETNFVADSEREVNTMIDFALKNKRKEYFELFAQYNEFIVQERDRLARLDELAKQIRIDRNQVRRLEKLLGLEDKQINRDKFERVVQDVKKGLITDGRIDITASGSRKRTKISISTVKDYL